MHDRIASLYDRTAAAWDEARSGTLIEQEWLDRFLGLVPPGGLILDLGCGSGRPIAHYLIERGYRVAGVDSSPALIALCRSRFPDQEWIVADMRRLALGRRFDALLAWHSFFHLHPDDQRPMFRRFADHARRGAVLMFTSGSEAGEAIGEWQGEPLYHASLSPEEYRDLLAASGFGLLSFTDGGPGAAGPTVWIARQINPASGLEGSA